MRTASVIPMKATQSILCIGATPAVQRVMVFRQLAVGAVNRATTTADAAAGKSVNVAKVLCTLGEPVVAAGFLGGARGQFVRGILKERGIGLAFVRVGENTRQCTTVIDERAGVQTELVEESRPVPPEKYRELERVVRRHVGRCRAVVMSGTLTPGAPRDFYRECTRIARAARVLSLVDAQGPALVEALKSRPGVVKPNRTELAATVGRPLTNHATIVSAMRELRELGAERVVITAGKEPTLAFDGRTVWRIRPPQDIAVNPIGSGDAFAAALVWRLLRGDDLGEACRWASAAGAANALTLMTGEVDREEVDRLARRTVAERVLETRRPKSSGRRKAQGRRTKDA
jgi:1-phosphofructokinase family hexose kinase